MNSKFDVITMGYIFNETTIFPDHTIGPLLGGPVSFSSICLGTLGVKTGIVSNIGIDTPKTLIKPFIDAKVDITGLNMREGITTTKDLLIYDENGNKKMEYQLKAPLILYNDIPDNYFNTSIFHLCSSDYEIPVETISLIKKRDDYLITADIGGFGGAHNSIESRKKYTSNKDYALERYMQLISIAKASMEDCYYLFGNSETTPEEAIKKLLGYGTEIVLITLGGKGALIGSTKKLVYIPPIDTDVVDCTGAGDTYMAAFISEYIKSFDIERSGYFATAAASILIEKTGGVNIERMPVREDVLKRLKVVYD